MQGQRPVLAAGSTHYCLAIKQQHVESHSAVAGEAGTWFLKRLPGREALQGSSRALKGVLASDQRSMKYLKTTKAHMGSSITCWKTQANCSGAGQGRGGGWAGVARWGWGREVCQPLRPAQSEAGRTAERHQRGGCGCSQHSTTQHSTAEQLQGQQHQLAALPFAHLQHLQQQQGACYRRQSRK